MWGISPKFVKRKKKILIDPRKEIYAKDDDFAFTLQSSGRDIPIVDIELGGVRLGGVFVDSGSTCNVIDGATWETLKEKKVKCVSRIQQKAVLLWIQRATYYCW